MVVKPSAGGTEIAVEFGDRRWVATWLPEGRRPRLAALRQGILKPWTIHDGTIDGRVVGTVGEPGLPSSRIGALTRRLSYGANALDFDDGLNVFHWKDIRIDLRWKGEKFVILEKEAPAGNGRTRWWTATIQGYPEPLEIPLALIGIGLVLRLLKDNAGAPFAV
jgi:hypothetical protein